MSTFHIDGNGIYCVKNAILYSKNFSGEKFGHNGNRGLCLNIDTPELLEALRNDGFNIKTRVFQETGDEVNYLPINISYDERFKDPDVKLYTHNGCRELSRDTIGMLDATRFENVWLYFRRAKATAGAYLKTFVATESASYGSDYPVPEFDGIPQEDLPFCD